MISDQYILLSTLKSRFGSTCVGVDFLVDGDIASNTAENMADYILNSVAPMLFMPHGLICTSVELWETENCCAVASLPEPTKEQVTWATRTLQSK